jgi:integrase
VKSVKAITSKEQVALMTVALKAVHVRFSLLWEVGISTGLRISDLLSLKPTDVTVSAFTIVESKTKNQRQLKFSLELFCLLRGYIALYRLQDDEYLFFSSQSSRKKPMTRQWAHRIIARSASRMGLNLIGAHSMRKIYACNLYASTGSLNAVRRELGHKSLSTTMIYLQDLLESILRA